MSGGDRRTIALRTTKIIAEVEQGVGWLTLNNPERRNAVSLEMWQGLGDAAEAFEAEQKKTYGEVASRGQQGLAQLSKPLIAMIQGFCIGGGLALALSADLRFATAASRFGIPAAKLGLGYEYPGIAALARLVGPSSAKDILFSARFLEADEALRLGLINFVVDEAQLESQVRDYALRIAGNAPLTVHAAKAAVRVFDRYSAVAGADEIDRLVDRCFNSDDYQEGRRAFMAKRAPHFQGR